VRSCYDLIFVARALERIGDHATNIAEDSFWRDQGDDIRHSYPPKKAKPDLSVALATIVGRRKENPSGNHCKPLGFLASPWGQLLAKGGPKSKK
jgi:hypothetical protein